LFVAYYLGKANGNATEAARMAGYAEPNTQGPRLLVNVGIRAAIDAKLDRVAMSADEVLARLSDIASADPADFIDFDPPPKPPPKNPDDPDEPDAWEDVGLRLRLDLAKRRGKTHLIKSIKAGKYGLSIELHDAQAALEKLAKYHGLLIEKIVTTATDAKGQAIERLLTSPASPSGDDPPGDRPG